MAIRIFEESGMGDSGRAPVRRFPPVASQTGTVTGSSQASSAFNAGTVLATIQADEACHVVFGASPTATTAGFKIGAGETHDFGVQGGDKVAWISA